MSLFQKRHYEWLAAFARHELRVGDRIALRNALDKSAKTSGKFDARKFDKESGADEYLSGVAAIRKSAGAAQ